MSTQDLNSNSTAIAVSLMEDIRKGRLRKTELIEACLSHMSDDQIYNMAIQEGFIIPDGDEDRKEDRIHYDDLTAQDKIIEKILARHGGN
jgi:hypothetical protein